MPGALFAPWKKRRSKIPGSTVLPTPSAPATPSTPYPADGATATYSLMSWVSSGATKFDLYFGTSASPPLLISNYVGTTYVPTLSASTTYFWKIVARNDGGTATGPVWSFTTPAATAVLFEIDGTLTTSRIRWPTLTIRDAIGAQPNTASALFQTVAPTAGQEIRIGLGLLDDDDLLFAGHIQSVDESYEELPGNYVWPVSMIDYTFTLNKRRPFASFVDVSASDIVRSLVTQYAPGFSTDGVQDGLPEITINFDGSKDFMSCLQDLANGIGGAGWTKVDYGQNVHLSLLPPGNDPDPLDETHPPENGPAIRFKTDLSQIRTRVYGKGHSETVQVAIAQGETILPLPDVTSFNAAGGKFIAGITADGAQTQIGTYTGVQGGTAGSLVGPGASPSTAPTLAPQQGSGLGTGVYQYAYTDVTGSGETIPSSLSTVTTGPIAAPGTAPTMVGVEAGTGIDVAPVQYAVTFVTGSGETTIGPASSQASPHDVTPPSVAPTSTENSGGGVAASWVTGDTIYTGITFVNGAGETTVGPTSTPYVATYYGVGPATFTHTIDSRNLPSSSDPTVTSKRVYINRNGTWIGYTSVTPSTSDLLDHDTTFGGAPPGANGAQVRKVRLQDIPIGPTGTTARKIYRWTASDPTYKLQQTISGNAPAGSPTDQTFQASLGAAAPGSNTTDLRQVNLSGISAGPSGTTQRKIYRTAVGASQLKLLTTLADNTTTTYGPDTAADGSLGANAPITDTSGLTAGTGQILAGSTTLVTSSAATFPETGWVTVGRQVIRYTGISVNTLTGIPASGSGAILTTIGYGSEVVPTPALRNINASNGVAAAMEIGSKVNILVQRDDTAAQASLASIEGGDGIREYMITDERRSEESLIALCDADLDRFARPIVEVMYCTRDIKTRAGKIITLELTVGMFDPAVFDPAVFDVVRAWGLSDEYLIQEVTINFDSPYALPRFSVHAASSRFTFGDLIQRVQFVAA